MTNIPYKIVFVLFYDLWLVYSNDRHYSKIYHKSHKLFYNDYSILSQTKYIIFTLLILWTVVPYKDSDANNILE